MSAESAYLATHVPVPTSAVTAKNDTIALGSTDGIEARAKDQVCDAFLDCALSPPVSLPSLPYPQLYPAPRIQTNTSPTQEPTTTFSTKPPPPPPPPQPPAPSTSPTPSVSGFNVGSPLTALTAMVTKPTPLPTEPPGVATVSSSVVPGFNVGSPLTDEITGPSPDAYCWEADNGQVHCVWTYTHVKLAKRTDAPEPAGSLTEREVVSVPTTLVTAVKREGEAAEKLTGGPRLPYFTRAA